MAEQQQSSMWNNMTVDNVTFHTNNVVGNFNYPPNVPAYKPIMKFLLNYPLRKAFTNCPSVVYQNFLREFWSTVVAYDPFPSTDETNQCPLREFLIKFSVLNGQRPLTLDFNTFCSSTGLDYNNGKYVAHPTPEAVLGGNYSFTKQVNSIQQLLAYCLITGTEVDIGEIIYNDLVTKLLNKSRLKYVSYPRFISCALQVLLGSDYTQDENFGFLPSILSNSNLTKDPSKVTDIELTAHMIAVNSHKDLVSPLLLSAKPKKGKSQTVTSTLPKLQGPEAPGALSKKRQKPKSKKPPIKTKGPTTHPKDSGGNIQPLNMDLTSTTSDEGTTKTTPRFEGTGAKYHVDETQSTRLRYRSLTKNKGKTSSEVEPDTEPLQLQTFADVQAFLLSEDELDKESDEEEVLAAREDMDEDPHIAEEIKTPPTKKDQLEPSHVQESTFDSSSPDLKKFDNILPLTERQLIKSSSHVEAAISYADLKASIEEYYDENVAHRDQTDKLVKTTMSTIDRSSTTIKDLYQGLDVITKLLKDISTTVKDDPATNKKIDESIETFAKISTNNTEAFKGQSSSAPSSSVTPTLALTNIPANVKGEDVINTATKEPPSHTEGETEDPKMAIPISSTQPTEVPPTQAQPITTITTHPESSQAAPRIDKGKGIATESDKDPSKKLVPASTIVRPDPDEEVKVPYMINKVYTTSLHRKQALLGTEERNSRKAVEEARPSFYIQG
ncbi:hypothetical protein Tco_0059890 [Tanacetum coccineum]